MSVNALTGDEMLALIDEIRVRKNFYLNILSDSTQEDCTKEFLTNLQEDVMFIKKIRRGQCYGLLANALDSFEQMLLTMPVQVQAINEMRLANEKTE